MDVKNVIQNSTRGHSNSNKSLRKTFIENTQKTSSYQNLKKFKEIESNTNDIERIKKLLREKSKNNIKNKP